MKIGIVYYSLEGNTNFLAECMAKEFNTDLIRLTVKQDINSKSFSKFIWGGKQVIFKQSPELEPYDFNKDLYDLIVIGTPVWAFTYAPAIRTFVTNTDLKDKKIALFCCCGGSAGKTILNLKESLGVKEIIGEIIFKEPIKDNKEQCEKAVNWLKSLI